MSVFLVTPPDIEPITLAEAKLQCGFGPMEDSDRAASLILSDKLRGFMLAARQAIENHTQRAFITQRWQLVLDGFPGRSIRYQSNGYPQIELPKPPFQSVDSFQYIATDGSLQALALDASYGTDPLAPTWAYQLERGSETQPGRLLSSYPRIFPPTRLVPGNVIVRFRCGYGCPITATIAADSAVLSIAATGVLAKGFNPDDAPTMAGETGLPISIPGAGANGSTLNTFIAAVDMSGNATLADQAQTAVAGVVGWAGRPVPEPIRNAIKMLVECYYDQGYAQTDELPPAVAAMLKPYLNWVS